MNVPIIIIIIIIKLFYTETAESHWSILVDDELFLPLDGYVYVSHNCHWCLVVDEYLHTRLCVD